LNVVKGRPQLPSRLWRVVEDVEARVVRNNHDDRVLLAGLRDSSINCRPGRLNFIELARRRAAIHL
jgi:hypothetical protein